LFEERPIWSRSGIDARCHIPQLKKYLGSTAYHFTVGPWRLLWVKFGYDPRKDTKSKIYQSIDFRVPREYSDVPLGAVAPQTKSHTSEEASSSTEIPDRKDKPSVVFGPSNLPTQKFSIYQLCDLQDDALQDIVHANDGNEPSECHPITGWCESQAYDKIRKRMAEVFRAAVDHSHQEIRNTPTKS
jgi:general transcription factor 3C polypeptide 5 (transcription factor C subunit 1)